MHNSECPKNHQSIGFKAVNFMVCIKHQQFLNKTALKNVGGGDLIRSTSFKSKHSGSSHHGTAETNLTVNYEVVGSIPGLAQWVKDPALP